MASVMASTMTSAIPSTTQSHPASSSEQPSLASMALKYRGATVEDLDPPPALSLNPTSTIDYALSEALSHDYTHLTIVSTDTRALLGYLSIPQLQALLASQTVTPNDPVSRAMTRFRRSRRHVYKVIHMGTPLEELEAFFAGVGPDGHGAQDFAVVTDPHRKFLLGVATKEDLLEFVKRRPT